AADRREGTSDLTSQGGRNHGTVIGKPPTVAVGSTLWAPEVQNAKLPTAYSKGTVNLFNSRQGTYLLPHQRRASIYLAGDLDFSPTSQLFSDALVTKRWIKDKSAALGLPLTITKVSPWYWSPTGGTAPIVAYYGFLQELGPETLNNDVLDGNFDVGLKTTMANWAVNLKLGYSTEVQHEVVSGLVNPGALASSLISPERSLAFNPFGVNNASVLQAISSS